MKLALIMLLACSVALDVLASELKNSTRTTGQGASPAEIGGIAIALFFGALMCFFCCVVAHRRD
jgi:hypothetical protein